MHDLLALGARAGALLKQRGETVSVGETSSGGLIAGISLEQMRASAIRSSSEQYALLLATEIRARLGHTTWGLAETGAAGPDGNSYGDPPGHTCIAVVGAISVTRTVRTGLSDRVSNMWAFAEATLALFVEVLEAAPLGSPPHT
jgi:nicotinamide-nucleotide amidase